MRPAFYSIVVISVSVLLAWPGCTRVKVTPPPPQLFALYPLEVTSDQLGQAYIADPNGADAKYKDKEIWITQTVVAGYVADNGNYGTISLLPTFTQIFDDSHDGILQVIDLMAVDCKIITIHSTQPFAVGDMVEIIGICQGLQDGNITVDISIINKIGASVVRTGVNMGY